MAESKHPIDKLFSERLAGHKVNAPVNAWYRLQRDLHKPAKTRFFWYSRAAAAMVVAALAASGETTIKGLNYLDRGYDRLDLKLQKLGAKIERVEATEAQGAGIEAKSSETTNGTASVSG